MENDPYTQGIIRNVKHNLIAGIILAVIATLVSLIACSPGMTIEEKKSRRISLTIGRRLLIQSISYLTVFVT